MYDHTVDIYSTNDCEMKFYSNTISRDDANNNNNEKEKSIVAKTLLVIYAQHPLLLHWSSNQKMNRRC